MLDQETKAFLDQIAADPPPSWEELGATAAREAFKGFAELAGPAAQVGGVDEYEVDGLSLRVYRGSPEPGATLVMFFHGGGWVLGDLDSHDTLCRNLAAGARATVVAVDYPLAPDAKWPAQPVACYRATEWAVENAAELGADADRLAVVGDSAGGHLATAVCLMALDRGAPTIQKSVLFYPVVADNFETESYQQFAEGYGLTRADMQRFWEQLLGSAEGSAPAYANALDSKSLVGMPKTLIITAENDVLRDEGELLHSRLVADGIDAKLTRVEGVIHGFVHLAGLFSASQKPIEQACAFLRDG